MKNFLTSAVTCLLLLSTAIAELKYDGDQVWKVKADTKEKLVLLRDFAVQNSGQIDIWKEAVNVETPAHLHIPHKMQDAVRNTLEGYGLEIDIMIEDMRSLIMDSVKKNNRQKEGRKVKTPKSFMDFNYEEYHPADEIDEWIDMVAAEVPYVTKFQIGVTYEGRTMWALKIQKDPTIKKPTIYLDALIHCREWIGTAATVWMFAQVFSDPALSYLTDNADWYYIPMINKDGYVHTWTDLPNNRLWRKTRSKGVNLEKSDLCQGVDANRNWPAQTWAGDGASGNPCDITYYGPGPASESEVRHLTYFIQSMNDTITAVVSVHSYSQLILWPFNYAEGVYPPNKEEHDTLGQAMADAMYTVEGKTYVQGQGAEVIYVCSGVTTDWTPETGIELHFTFELRDEGEYGFVLPPDQIVPNGQEMLLAMNKLYEQVVARSQQN